MSRVQYLKDSNRCYVSRTRESTFSFSTILLYITAVVSADVRLQDNDRRTHSKVRGSKSVRGGGSGCGGGGGVGEVGIDISKQVAHHCWHTGTHVFGGQTGEVPTEEKKQLLFYRA